MKLLFVYDMRVYENQGSYYTTSITQEVIDRYRSICGTLSWCTCIIPNSDETFCRRFNQINRNSVSMCSLDKINTISGLLRSRKENNRILEQAVKNHDLLIIRLPSMIGVRAVRLAEKHHKTYMVELVSCTWDALWNHSIKGKLIAPYFWLLIRNTMKRVPLAMYVTNRFLQKRYPCGGVSIGCSDVSLPEPDPEKLKRRWERIEKAEQSGNPVRLGTLAAVNVRYKGQQYVIAAMGKLKQQGIHVEYELAGSGDQTYLLSVAKKWGVEGQVHFLGSMPHEKVFSWFEDLDIYIQPSKQEGLPRAVVEAMSCACPVMGARTGGIPELIAPRMVFKAGRTAQICRILYEMTAGELKKQAELNFHTAMEYEKERLDSRRQHFYERFHAAATPPHQHMTAPMKEGGLG